MSKTRYMNASKDKTIKAQKVLKAADSVLHTYKVSNMYINTSSDKFRFFLFSFVPDQQT